MCTLLSALSGIQPLLQKRGVHRPDVLLSQLDETLFVVAVGGGVPVTRFYCCVGQLDKKCLLAVDDLRFAAADPQF